MARRESFDLVAFARYERYNTQQQMPSGYLPLQQFNRSSWIAGLTFKPTPDVAVKFDYNFNSNESAWFGPLMESIWALDGGFDARV